MDRKSFTFMRSYPNFIPLSAKGARAIGAALEPFRSTPSTATFSTGSSRRAPSQSCRHRSSATSPPLAATYDQG